MVPLIPDAIATSRLQLPLWSAELVADLRNGRRRPDWHRDFPRRDDVDAAGLWVDGDPWGPRSIIRGVTTLGSIGFFGPPAPTAEGVDEVEVGYGLVREAWGYGFATEALAGLLAAIDELGATAVRARTEPENTRSVRVLAKSGFTELRGADEDGLLVMARPAG